MGEAHKSTIAQMVAASIATGAEIIRRWLATVRGPVLWLDYESSRKRFKRRQRLLCLHRSTTSRASPDMG